MDQHSKDSGYLAPTDPMDHLAAKYILVVDRHNLRIRQRQSWRGFSFSFSGLACSDSRFVGASREHWSMEPTFALAE